MGRIEAIWIKRARGGPMDPATSARLLAGRGLVGNANQGGKRQVTVIAAEGWRDAESELGSEIDPSTRRANVLVSGVDLIESRGRILQLGSVAIRLIGETRPCRQMEESCTGLQEALSPAWRGGAYGEVLDDGEIEVGDSASLTGTGK